MWTYTFVNQYGITFTYTTGEGGPDLSDLEYIRYCVNLNSILVDMKPAEVIR